MNLARKLRLTLGGLLVVAVAAASEFDVASVKQFERRGEAGVQSGAGKRQDLSFLGKSGKLFDITGTRVTIRGTLRSFIAAAYDIKDYQILNTPSWAGDLLYDVIARTPGDAVPTQEQVRPMFQSLLADRFQLKLHNETKVLPVYDLMPAKKNIGLKPSAPDETFHWDLKIQPDGTLRSHGFKESIGDFIQLVGVSADRPVIDKTGVTGYIDYDILIAQDSRNPDDVNRAILDAVKDQLGLKLEAAKEPIEMFIVDRVEKPSEN